MKNDILKTNILVIGRSGVGKSSLLNYIFDDDVEKTGAGHPITEKGVFPHEYKRDPDDDFTFVIYDSWGLEPDKAEEWSDMVLSEVKEHEQKSISEWFSTIIYCLNAVSGRVEDFELDMMKRFREENNNIIVAITHCKNRQDDPISINAEAMKKRITDNTDIPSESIVFVSSCEKKTIGGGVTVRFGKEEIITQIISNLWLNFKNKIPNYVRRYVDDEIRSQHDRMHKKVEFTPLLFHRKNALKDFSEKINEEFKLFVRDLVNEINAYFNDAYNYYNSLSLRYYMMGFYLNENDLYKNPNMFFDVTKDFKQEISDSVNKISDSAGKILKFMNEEVTKQLLIDFAYEVKTYLSTPKTIRKELYDIVDNYVNKAKRNIMAEINNIQHKIDSIDITKTYLLSEKVEIII